MALPAAAAPYGLRQPSTFPSDVLATPYTTPLDGCRVCIAVLVPTLAYVADTPTWVMYPPAGFRRLIRYSARRFMSLVRSYVSSPPNPPPRPLLWALL